MGFFLYKLIAPRVTFAQDMTDAEAQVMKVHSKYWSDLAARGVDVVFGPVLDPKGSLAIVEAKDEGEVHAIGKEDPAIKSQFGFKFEVYPMLQAVTRKS